MSKIINIVLLLLYMNSPAYTQDFNLTENGLQQIQIGDSLNLQSLTFIKPVTERIDFLQIRFRDTEYFDYYYVKHQGGYITVDSLIISNIFIYTERVKGDKVSGLVLFVNKKYDTLLVSLLNKVFGAVQVEGASGASDVKWRITRLWVKEQIHVFVTDSFTELLEVHISPKRNDIRFPGLKFRN